MGMIRLSLADGKKSTKITRLAVSFFPSLYYISFS
jgi:hypothetical protein